MRFLFSKILKDVSFLMSFWRQTVTLMPGCLILDAALCMCLVDFGLHFNLLLTCAIAIPHGTVLIESVRAGHGRQ